MEKITITRPDDWHVHIRDGQMLKTVVLDTAAQFSRAIIMPNLKPPCATTAQSLQYRDEILNALPATSTFTPLMTLYLTEDTAPNEIKKAKESGHIYAVKLYPAGATTNSNAGVKDVRKVYAVLEQMQLHNMPLLIHGEVVDSSVDVFDREAVFIENTLKKICKDFPALKIVLEHITTQQAVDFVSAASDNIGATITPHHLLLNRNAMFEGGIQAHHYCLPIIKRETHRQALVKAATSGNVKFFLGTDSAPHLQKNKETSCGCAGIYSAHAAIEFYAQCFADNNALDKLEGFASHNGHAFYGLPRNQEQITLIKESWKVDDYIEIAGEKLIPFYAGQTLDWKLK